MGQLEQLGWVQEVLCWLQELVLEEVLCWCSAGWLQWRCLLLGLQGVLPGLRVVSCGLVRAEELREVEEALGALALVLWQVLVLAQRLHC